VAVTLLGEWLKRNGVSQGDFGRRLSPPVGSDMTNRWAWGTRLPGCMYAVAIEDATGGAVTVRYWAAMERSRSKRGNRRKR
jgi:hypothetical protein